MTVLNHAGKPLKPMDVKAVAGPAPDDDWHVQWLAKRRDN